MLQSLHIKNYALIENLAFSPSPNFNIITGETGAGKSIMLGAIGLLTGDRADAKALLDTEQKCVIEGVFDLSTYKLQPIFEANELDFEPITTIRREISPQGKSRAFVNDTPVTLDTLKEITGRLLDVHSQHDNLMLGSADFQLEIVDIFAENTALLTEYKFTYKTYRQLKKQVEELLDTAAKSKKDFDYESFLLKELIDIQLTEGEQEKLEDEFSMLENAEEIKLKLNLCVEALSEGEISVNMGLSSVISNLAQLSKLATAYEQLKDRTNATLAELKDITKELERAEEKIEADPQRASELKSRLDSVYKLQKKHGVQSINELLSLQTELTSKVSSYNSLDTKIITCEKELKSSIEKLNKLATAVTQSREKVFKGIETNLTAQLRELGMPNNTFLIKNEQTDFTTDGRDKVQMLFSANKGIEPVTLKNAASGGEFSRLMFALKYLIASASALPTMIFDEIDTGISGEIAMKMGNMMQKMAKGHQLITITHLHQIAAKGDSHFFVYKDETAKGTKTNIRALNTDERLQEIAQMIGGKNPSATAFESAKEMLNSFEF